MIFRIRLWKLIRVRIIVGGIRRVIRDGAWPLSGFIVISAGGFLVSILSRIIGTYYFSVPDVNSFDSLHMVIVLERNLVCVSFFPTEVSSKIPLRLSKSLTDISLKSSDTSATL